MEKLETILRAEATSRRSLEAAREHTQDLLKEARAQAELIAIEAEKQAEDAAETIRVRNLTDANIEVEIIAAQSKTQLTVLVETAEARFAEAVGAVVHELTGGR